jgi:hypothetical protein
LDFLLPLRFSDWSLLSSPSLAGKQRWRIFAGVDQVLLGLFHVLPRQFYWFAEESGIINTTAAQKHQGPHGDITCKQEPMRSRLQLILTKKEDWSYPQGDPPAGCHDCNCRLNICRMFHCHHCCCCCMCRMYHNHHSQSTWCWVVAMKYRGNHWVFRRHCRLNITSWLEWCHCHCSWRSRRLSFAIVDRFGVAMWCGKKSEWNN